MVRGAYHVPGNEGLKVPEPPLLYVPPVGSDVRLGHSDIQRLCQLTCAFRFGATLASIASHAVVAG